MVDDITEANLTGKRSEIFKLITELKSVKIDSRFNKKARSRYLKTSMRQIIEGDFLYIDVDTIIAEDLSDIENIDIDIGAILNDHTYLSEYEKYRPARLREIKAAFKKRGFNSGFDFKIYFNGGIFLCRDCKAGHDFFNEWHRLWLHCFELNMLNDQPSLNQANFNLGNVIKELDGIWNCQLIHDGALKYFHDAKIIHYFATNVHEKFFLLANKEYTEEIKETGIVDQKIKDMLKNPKAHIAPNTRIMLVDRSLREFYDSAICGAAKRIYYTRLGSAIEFVFSIIKKYIFTPLRKKLFTHR
jgi:lipopolysaccharide biosynthesis glycosyltransferase